VGYVFASILFYLFQSALTGCSFVLISGFIHDVSSFVDQHPGGRHYLIGTAGKEVTASFFGGVYAHSNAAHNVCASLLLFNQGFAEKYT
jgi:stearoyl-CoA desaturase (delta-9 desaturase)